MVEIFYRYRVHPSQAKAFEQAYGPAGDWAVLFSKHPGYRHTRLFRHKTDSWVYLSVDVWETKAQYDEFRRVFASAYAGLDERLALLKLEEHLLGFYDAAGERQPAVDSQA